MQSRPCPRFRQMLTVLPKPFGKTTSVDVCAKPFVSGPGDRVTLEHVPEILTQLDADVAALGRLTSARNVALESAAPAPD